MISEWEFPAFEVDVESRIQYSTHIIVLKTVRRIDQWLLFKVSLIAGDNLFGLRWIFKIYNSPWMSQSKLKDAKLSAYVVPMNFHKSVSIRSWLFMKYSQGMQNFMNRSALTTWREIKYWLENRMRTNRKTNLECMKLNEYASHPDNVNRIHPVAEATEFVVLRLFLMNEFFMSSEIIFLSNELSLFSLEMCIQFEHKPTKLQQPFGYLIGQINRKSSCLPFHFTNFTHVIVEIVLIAVMIVIISSGS